MVLVRERLEGETDPLTAARWLRGDHRPVVLAGRWAGGGVLLTSHPAREAAAREDPFELLDDHGPFAVDGDEGLPPVVGGGWFGWLGYGLGRMLERLPPAPPRPCPLPPFDLAYHDHVVRCDAHGRWWFEALWSDARAEVLQERLAIWRQRLVAEPPPHEPVSAGPLAPEGGGTAGHLRATAETVDRIAAGDLSQANVCMRLSGRLHGHPLDLWLQAVGAAVPAYAAYVGGPDHAVLSLSPELFLRRQHRVVESEPIKGTAPRTSDPAELQRSEKDRAENVMIVDLMRNDLGRICDYGSVEVGALCDVQPAAGVWHLVSSVRGRLRPEVGDAELLRATFPPGSVTGAPKVRAMTLINELESTAREVYCGAIGVCSPVSGLEFNVAIRTFETRAGQLWLGAGGGIVSDSSPAAEVDEAITKARGVCGLAGIKVAARPRRVTFTRAAIRHTRPDPSLGLREAIRVNDGVPRWIDLHIARLRASCDANGMQLDDDVARRIVDAAADVVDGSITVLTNSRGTTLTRGRLPGRGAVSLSPTLLAGGLGAHKWADRRLIDELSDARRAPLFVDLDETVLEAGHAAVALLDGRRLVVRPLDGRILPSISRSQLQNDAARAGYDVIVESFTLREARAAGALILTSALRGAHVGTLGQAAPGARIVAVVEELARTAVRQHAC